MRWNAGINGILSYVSILQILRRHSLQSPLSEPVKGGWMLFDEGYPQRSVHPTRLIFRKAAFQFYKFRASPLSGPVMGVWMLVWWLNFSVERILETLIIWPASRGASLARTEGVPRTIHLIRIVTRWVSGYLPRRGGQTSQIPQRDNCEIDWWHD